MNTALGGSFYCFAIFYVREVNTSVLSVALIFVNSFPYKQPNGICSDSFASKIRS